METLMSIVSFITENYSHILEGIVGILSGIIAICLVIPGPEPERTLQKIVGFLSKFSKK